MSSMSVHSLIDKYTNTDERPVVPRSRSGPPVLELNKERLDKYHLKDVNRPDIESTHSQTAPPNPSTNTPSQTTDPALLALLGPNITSFPWSESAFVEALRLRAEEERTKQEQIRLEIASKNLAIINKAIEHEVPAHMIPSMCVAPIPEGAIPQRYISLQSPQLPVYSQLGRRNYPSGDYSNISMGYPGVGPHQQSPFLAPSPSFGRNYDTLDNASSVAPINYRFGSGSKAPPPPHNRRPLSPAKLGAAAVANLANPVTPYRPSQRTLPTHQRHFSMPAETLSSPQRTLERTRNRNSQNVQLQSPLGATSSIQVRPSPAQPLNKQTKNSQIPSQESMTSHQHIIQFHHWKPENPGESEIGSVSSGSLARGLFSHKRHKSNDMSVDLLLTNQEFIGSSAMPPSSIKREHEADVSMDTSDVTITEKEAAGEPSQTSTGKFPHDILLTNR
ncbi:CIC11C00000005236 [Sungouiella intermedia]|uniref:CIC11C00000005236 n=1 Tax=Sungouiella intermedia TaxID=45354 RepID=A0A1L0BJI7_9ASCO|nr:CIC11C00000005236 [[Candida] intermedia]